MALQLPLLDPHQVAPTSSSRRHPHERGAARPGRISYRTTSPSGPGDAPYWRLDDHTRELGLRGVEEARRALAAAVQRTGRASAA